MSTHTLDAAESRVEPDVLDVAVCEQIVEDRGVTAEVGVEVSRVLTGRRGRDGW